MTPQRACPLGTAAHGLALPTVLILCMVCSVWLLAGWRNISLAQGWGQAHTQRWQLQQAALSALADLVSQVTLPAPSTPSTQSGSNPNTATPAWPPKSAPRLFVERRLEAGLQLPIEGQQAHYLAKVMRVAPGDARSEEHTSELQSH